MRMCVSVSVCVCALACAGGSNALCETKRNGRTLYDSVISLWVTYAHTRRPGLRGGQHTETVVPTHTDQNNVFVRKENSFMGHTPTPTHTHRRWRPLSMPLCRTAQLSLCTSLFSLRFSFSLSFSSPLTLSLCLSSAVAPFLTLNV